MVGMVGVVVEIKEKIKRSTYTTTWELIPTVQGLKMTMTTTKGQKVVDFKKSECVSEITILPPNQQPYSKVLSITIKPINP